MLFCQDHIDGDDGGDDNNSDGDGNGDVVDKVQPQLAPLHQREPQLLRLPSQGSCLPPSTGPAGGLGSLFFCNFCIFGIIKFSHPYIGRACRNRFLMFLYLNEFIIRPCNGRRITFWHFRMVKSFLQLFGFLKSFCHLWLLYFLIRNMHKVESKACHC